MSKIAALKRANFDIARALSDAPIEAVPTLGGGQSGHATDSGRFAVGLPAVVLLQAGLLLAAGLLGQQARRQEQSGLQQDDGR